MTSSQPAKGHNRPKPTPELIREAFAKYTEHRTAIARLTARCGADMERFKEQGVNIKNVRKAWAEANKTEQEAWGDHAEFTQYLVAAGVMPQPDDEWFQTATQGTFQFSAGVTEKLAQANAERQGYKAGTKGHSVASNPYQSTPGSIEFVAWNSGWKDGAADRKARKPEVTEASDHRQRREPPSATAEETRDAVAAEIAATSESVP